MYSNYISTLNLNASPRSAVSKLQTELARSTQELSTGTRADVSLDLGVRADASITLRNQKENLQAKMDNNTSIATQLATTQNALDDLRTNGQSFLDSLISLSNTGSATSTLSNDARLKMDSMVSTLNTSDGRRYLFGGVKSGSEPMKAYDSSAKTALSDAFQAQFGFGTDDDQVSTITPAAMESFLNGAFADQFSDANWSANWSGASDTARSSAISTSETIKTSVSANETAMRKLAMAYSAVSEFASTKLSPETFEAIVGTARDLAGQGIAGLTQMGADVGFAQSRIETVNTMLSKAADNTDTKLSTLESVDPAETKARIDSITTQIQMSYSMTTQLMKLSIMNYV